MNCYRQRSNVFFVLAVWVTIDLAVLGSELGGSISPQLEYTVRGNWPELPDGWNLGLVTSVAEDSEGNIWVFNRGEHPLMEFKPDGTFVRSIAEGKVDTAHGLIIDSDDNIWITDVGTHTVTKLDQEGHVLMVLGERGVAGADSAHFDRPANVNFAPNGDFFVADGYGNSRVMKFDKSGRFIKSWGKKGTGAGEFDLVHEVALDSSGLVYIADRENDRIQIFDLNGRFLKMWTHLGAPFGFFMTADDRLFLTDGRGHKIRIVDVKTGEVLASFGSEGSGPGEYQMPHDVFLSRNGDLYIADLQNERVQKLSPRR